MASGQTSGGFRNIKILTTPRMMALVNRYKDALGLADVSYRIYPGARHEILNETNREEVHSDISAWLDARV